MRGYNYSYDTSPLRLAARDGVFADWFIIIYIAPRGSDGDIPRVKAPRESLEAPTEVCEVAQRKRNATR